MKIHDTFIDGLKIIEPAVFHDNRGLFFESYNRDKYFDSGISADFVQDNESSSVYGVVRGLHYQVAPYDQAKLVRVVSGRVFDVAVDLRKGSPTFGRWFGIELSGENRKQLFIPRGFAHGFSVLSQNAIFSYKCDNCYHQPSDRAIRFDDPGLNISWQIPEDDLVVSAKDRSAPFFEEAELKFS